MKPQARELVDLFAANGGRLTLHQIMQTTLAAEYRARMTELRGEGFTIECERGHGGADNVYQITPPPAFDSAGQGVLSFEPERRRMPRSEVA